MKKWTWALVFLSLLVLGGVNQIVAQPGSPGFWVRTDCTTLPTPVNDQTICQDGTVKALRVFSGGSWITLIGSGGPFQSGNPLSFTFLNGAPNSGFFLINPVASGSVQQFALASQIVGIATGGTGAGRLAGVFAAGTGGGTGAGTGNPIWGLNVFVQQSVGDTNTGAIGIELDVNNNRVADNFDLSGILHEGYSAVSGGTFSASVAFDAGGGGQWSRGFRVDPNGIVNASGNYAFEYGGSTTNSNQDKFTVTWDGKLELGFQSNLGSFGEMMMRNAKNIYGLNAAGNALVSMIQVDATNRVFLAPGGANILTGTGAFLINTTVTSGANGGDAVIAAAGVFRSVNNAGTGTMALINHCGGASDFVCLGSGGNDIQWGKALVSLGGGAAPTFGTIGGSGPATAAQNSWMQVRDNGGNAFWVPVWK